MNPIQENVLMVSILKWLREHKLAGNHDSPEITEDIDVLKNGFLDSLGLVHLLLFVEEQTGRSIDLRTVEPEDICVVKSLCRIALGKPISPSEGECNDAKPRGRDLLAAGRKV